MSTALATRAPQAAPDLLQRWVDARWAGPGDEFPTPMDLTQPTQLLVTRQSDEALQVLDRGQTYRPTLEGIRRHESFAAEGVWAQAYRWLEAAYDARVDAGHKPRRGPLVWTWPEAAAPWRLHESMHSHPGTFLLLEVPSARCLPVGWDEWHGPLNGSVHLNLPYEDDDFDDGGLMDQFDEALAAAHQARTPAESLALWGRWWEATCLGEVVHSSAEWLQVVIDRIEPSWVRERVILPACTCNDW